jgi:hypothetical protein
MTNQSKLRAEAFTRSRKIPFVMVLMLFLLHSCAGTHHTKYMYAPYSFQNDPIVLETGKQSESLAFSNGFSKTFEPEKYAYVDVSYRYGLASNLDAGFHWGLNQRVGFYYAVDSKYQLFEGEANGTLSLALSSTGRLKWDIEETAMIYQPFSKDLIRVIGLHPGFQLRLGDTFMGLSYNAFSSTNKEQNPYSVENYFSLNLGHWFFWQEHIAPELILLYGNRNEFQPSIWFRIRFMAFR